MRARLLPGAAAARPFSAQQQPLRMFNAQPATGALETALGGSGGAGGAWARPCGAVARGAGSAHGAAFGVGQQSGDFSFLDTHAGLHRARPFHKRLTCAAHADPSSFVIQRFLLTVSPARLGAALPGAHPGSGSSSSSRPAGALANAAAHVGALYADNTVVQPRMACTHQRRRQDPPAGQRAGRQQQLTWAGQVAHA